MRPIVLVLAAALAVTGCGGDDDELSADEYRERANELCADAERELEKLDLPESPDEIADWFGDLLDRSRPYDQDFKELDPPKQLEDLHDQAVRLSERLDTRFRDMIERLRQAEDPAVLLQREFERLTPEIERSDELNRGLGLERCLEPLLEDAPPSTS